MTTLMDHLLALLQMLTSTNPYTHGLRVPIASVALDADIAQMLLLKTNYLVDVRCAKNNLIV